MLKLTLRPGDLIDIGEEIKVVFTGGSQRNIHLLVGAPKEMNIVRSTAMKEKGVSPYRAEAGISQEAQNQIVEIIKREKREQYRKRAMQ